MNNKTFHILAINPGSTSTKIAVYKNEEPVIIKTVRHEKTELEKCGGIINQLGLRLELVLKTLNEANIDLNSLDAIVGRGGLVRPIDSGVYSVNKRMLDDLKSESTSTHASNLGAIIAHEISQKCNKPSYIVDPVVVDELDQYAKLSGFPGIERKSIFHALNQKAIARMCSKKIGIPYEDARFVVAHMGGGISVGAHKYGRVVDVNNALEGEGAFSPDRTGSVPLVQVVELCYSGKYTKKEINSIITGKGGMIGYIDTNDLMECEKRIKEGDLYANLVFETMAYQVSKEIGAMCAVLEGRVDSIVLTGGLAKSDKFIGSIKQRVGLLAPVNVFGGEDEMLALVQGALRILNKEENALEY